jgi:hypothetical protein
MPISLRLTLAVRAAAKPRQDILFTTIVHIRPKRYSNGHAE